VQRHRVPARPPRRRRAAAPRRGARALGARRGAALRPHVARHPGARRCSRRSISR
jgi:hypothetical protein